MNNWTAPLLVFVLGTIGFTIVGEPAGIALVAAISVIGYSLNKAGN